MRNSILILLAAAVLGCTQDTPDASAFAESKTPDTASLDSNGDDAGKAASDTATRKQDTAAVDLSSQPDIDSGGDTFVEPDVAVDSGTGQDQLPQDAPEDTPEPDTFEPDAGGEDTIAAPYKVSNPLGAEKMLWENVSHQMNVCSNCLSSKLGCSKDGKFMLECKYDFKQSCYTWQKQQDCTVWPQGVKKFHATCRVYACAKLTAKMGGGVGCLGLTKKDSLNAPCSDDKPCFLFDKCKIPPGYTGTGIGGSCEGTSYYESGACDDGESCTKDYCQELVSDGKGNWVKGPWCRHEYKWNSPQSTQCKWLHELKTKSQTSECFTDPFNKKSPPDPAKCPWKTDYP